MNVKLTKLCGLLAVMILLWLFAGSAMAGPYGTTYSGGSSYGYYYGSGYYYAPTAYYTPTYSYYTPSYYTAPSYCAPATYSYEYQAAGWWHNRWFPAGYWRYADGVWYLKGYGAHPGFASPQPPTVITPEQAVVVTTAPGFAPQPGAAPGIGSTDQVNQLLLQQLLLKQLQANQVTAPVQPQIAPVAPPPGGQLSAEELAQLRALLQQLRQPQPPSK